jgi:hypothetical protein
MAGLCSPSLAGWQSSSGIESARAPARDASAGEGRERAKARGVKFGRKPQLTEHQKREAIRRRNVDGETAREIARSYNVSHSAISRLTA